MARNKDTATGAVQSPLSRFISYALLIIVALILMAPIFFMITSSVKPEEEYMRFPVRVFATIAQWSNYRDIFILTPFGRIALQTAGLGLLIVVLNVMVSSMVGFAFARYRDVKANGKLFTVVVAMLMVPVIVIVIPQFIIFSKIRLTNTYWPWILGALGGSPFFIFLFRQFFLTFPRELEEAAEIDGCSAFRIYWQIFLPNAKAAMATVAIFSFIGVWGDYFGSLIYLSGKRILLGHAMAFAFKNPQGFVINTVSLAGGVLYIVPLVIIFFIFQKNILKGVVTTGIKG